MEDLLPCLIMNILKTTKDKSLNFSLAFRFVKMNQDVRFWIDISNMTI